MPNSGPMSSEQILSNKRHTLIEEVIIILLVILSLGGIGVMKFSPTEGYWYWVIMIFVFGMGAMIISYVQSKQGKHVIRDIWIDQSLHWFGVILALLGTLILLYSRALDEENTGLVILLLLSLATYIDGLRISWRLSLVGNFLGLTAVSIAFFENFLLILLGLAAMTIGLTVYWEKLRRSDDGGR